MNSLNPSLDKASRSRSTHQGESSARPMRQAHTGLAMLVRGSSRRIMTMRLRPANIRLINRRRSAPAAAGPVQEKQNYSPTLAAIDRVTPYQGGVSSLASRQRRWELGPKTLITLSELIRSVILSRGRGATAVEGPVFRHLPIPFHPRWVSLPGVRLMRKQTSVPHLRDVFVLSRRWETTTVGTTCPIYRRL